jgi:hypothetical protein
VVDVEIRLVVGAVLFVEAVPVGVQAVTVLHSELTEADQPGARTRVVAPLRAYPNNPAARKAISAQAKCRKAM